MYTNLEEWRDLSDTEATSGGRHIQQELSTPVLLLGVLSAVSPLLLSLKAQIVNKYIQVE